MRFRTILFEFIWKLVLGTDNELIPCPIGIQNENHGKTTFLIENEQSKALFGQQQKFSQNTRKTYV